MNQTFEETFHQLSWDWSKSFHSDYTQPLEREQICNGEVTSGAHRTSFSYLSFLKSVSVYLQKVRFRVNT